MKHTVRGEQGEDLANDTHEMRRVGEAWAGEEVDEVEGERGRARLDLGGLVVDEDVVEDWHGEGEGGVVGEKAGDGGDCV